MRTHKLFGLAIIAPFALGSCLQTYTFSGYWDAPAIGLNEWAHGQLIDSDHFTPNGGPSEPGSDPYRISVPAGMYTLRVCHNPNFDRIQHDVGLDVFDRTSADPVFICDGPEEFDSHCALTLPAGDYSIVVHPRLTFDINIPYAVIIRSDALDVPCPPAASPFWR